MTKHITVYIDGCLKKGSNVVIEMLTNVMALMKDVEFILLLGALIKTFFSFRKETIVMSSK